VCINCISDAENGILLITLLFLPKTIGANREIICCWSSPAHSFLVSGPVGADDNVFVRSKITYLFFVGAETYVVHLDHVTSQQKSTGR
jgi:hypothetical protein